MIDTKTLRFYMISGVIRNHGSTITRQPQQQKRRRGRRFLTNDDNANEGAAALPPGFFVIGHHIHYHSRRKRRRRCHGRCRCNRPQGRSPPQADSKETDAQWGEMLTTTAADNEWRTTFPRGVVTRTRLFDQGR
jgi:hypothetical protein